MEDGNRLAVKTVQTAVLVCHVDEAAGHDQMAPVEAHSPVPSNADGLGKDLP